MKQRSEAQIKSQNKWYKKNAGDKVWLAARLQKVKDGRKKYKKLVFDYYGWVCNCCGEANQLFLTIDHINNDGFKQKRKDGRRVSGWLLYKWIVENGFPIDYQVLCMNCNHGKRMNNGVCPHVIIYNG